MTGPAADSDPEPTDGQSTHEQRIRVEGGVAYGVVGASLHVWGEDVLPYLLENWHDGPAAARHEAAGFTGRAAELSQLHQWRRSNPRLAVRWLYGAPGTGKTCLAARFASESAACDWKVITATPGSGKAAPVPDGQDLKPGTAEGVLLIIDNADQWPRAYLALLLSDMRFRRPDGRTRTRVLMISRSLDDWPEVRHKLISEQPVTSSQPLEPRGIRHDC